MRGFILALPITLGSLVLQAADWPVWRGPNHNGISQETVAPWSTPPKTVWKASVGIGFSSFAASGGNVYTLGNKDDTESVYCLDAKTGKVRWEHRYPAPLDPQFYVGGPSATPTVDEGRLYTVGKHGDIFCLDAEKGTVLWETHLKKEGYKLATWGLAGSAIPEGSMVLFNAGSGGLALDKKTGKTIWASDKSENGYSSAVLYDSPTGRAAIFALENSFAAFATKDGREIWRFPWKTGYDVNASDAIVAGSNVWISAGYGHGCALLSFPEGKATALYVNKNLRSHCNPPVLVKDCLYGFDGDVGDITAFVCLDLRTGQKKWSEGRVGAGSVMAAGTRLLILTYKGELLLANAVPEKFDVICRAQVLEGKGWTVPVQSNGNLYCRNMNGDVVCLQMTKR